MQSMSSLNDKAMLNFIKISHRQARFSFFGDGAPTRSRTADLLITQQGYKLSKMKIIYFFMGVNLDVLVINNFILKK